jgi:hypothetical protein
LNIEHTSAQAVQVLEYTSIKVEVLREKQGRHQKNKEVLYFFPFRTEVHDIQLNKVVTLTLVIECLSMYFNLIEISRVFPSAFQPSHWLLEICIPNTNNLFSRFLAHRFVLHYLDKKFVGT